MSEIRSMEDDIVEVPSSSDSDPLDFEFTTSIPVRNVAANDLNP